MIAVLLLCQIVCLSSNPPFQWQSKMHSSNASSKCYLGDTANHPPYSITALMKTKAFGVMLAQSLFRHLNFPNKLYIFYIAVVLDVAEQQNLNSHPGG